MLMSENREMINPAESAVPVADIPTEVLESLEKQIQEAGGAFKLPEEYKGSIGRTLFDTSSSKDGTVTVVTPCDSIESVPKQALVRIRSVLDKKAYLGAVVEGPFAEPDV